ncbi:MAG TPA: NUDIX domain-containing protein [Candidatus Paceibacterota bacterium]|nr:NUDIX domain-containing protein [Candidatus Paceibacterota bacterium]
MEPKKDFCVGVIPFHQAASETLFCLIQHAAGNWGFPKGHQDPGESEEETARRELREEAGIETAELDISRFFQERYTFKQEGVLHDKTVHYFLGRVDATDNAIPGAFRKEIPDMRWLPIAEARELIRSQSKHLVDEARSYLESQQ